MVSKCLPAGEMLVRILPATGQGPTCSRTLRTMEGYGLVRLANAASWGRFTPKVTHDRVELDLPLTLARKAS